MIKFFFSLCLIAFLAGNADVHAQATKLPDSLAVSGGFGDAIARMPVYNPKDGDAKIMVLKSLAKPIDNMPIIDQKDICADLIGRPELRKCPLQQWPSHVNGNQKDKPAEQK